MFASRLPRNGGSLGETGSVNYMFDRKGYIVIKREDHALRKTTC